MTARARRILPAAMAALVAAGGMAVAWSAPAGMAGRAGEYAAQSPECVRGVDGSWWCSFPSPVHPARVVVTAYEDGSATARVLDNGR